MDRRTKILCTVGPASLAAPMLRRMAAAGMDGVRINSAHGDFGQYAEIVKNLRAVADLPVMMDVKGPEIRTRLAAPLSVEAGREIEFSFGAGGALSFSYNFLGEVQPGARILIADGSLAARLVRSKGRRKGTLRFENSGTLRDRNGVNIPGTTLRMPSLSGKDRQAIRWSVRNKLAFIALSFTRSAADVETVRRLLGGSGIGIIAKIENPEGVRNADEILEAADGLMIARGDLGVEMASERVPMIQKALIRKCNQAGKLAITATQMLESMVGNPRPTRAETSDVANAILDGTDVVMLSSESSVGLYPVEAVAEMDRIARETDSHVAHRLEREPFRDVSSTIAASISSVASHMPVDKIVAVTTAGYTARSIARFRPRQPVLAITPRADVARQLRLVWGVEPVVFAGVDSRHKISSSILFLLSKKLITGRDLAVFTAGARTRRPHASNVMEVHYISDLLEFYGKRMKEDDGEN